MFENKKLVKKLEEIEKDLIKLKDEIFPSPYKDIEYLYGYPIYFTLDEKNNKGKSEIEKLREDINLILKHLGVEKQHKKCDKYILTPIKKNGKQKDKN